jgi:glycosyltransferase involved in cell wall biosynthesis
VPSGIPVVKDPAAVATIRAQYGDGHQLVGHFGTYGGLIKPLLAGCLSPLIETSDCRVLLLGHGSDAACQEMVARDPRFADLVHATGALSAAELSRHISACDVMLQPYPDGISSRRTSAMVALAHAVPMVTTAGALTESISQGSEAVVLVPVGDHEALAAATATLLADPMRRAAWATCGRVLRRAVDLRTRSRR